MCVDDSVDSSNPHGCRWPAAREHARDKHGSLDIGQQLPVWVSTLQRHPIHLGAISSALPGRHSMKMEDYLSVKAGIGEFRPRGRCTLVEAVELISEAISHCRDRRIDRRLVVTTGLAGASIPTLVDRFLMVEEWSRESDGVVVAAMVASPEYIHPQKFGITVAADFGLVADIFTSESDALRWLANYAR
jgi:hypothetical protein